MRKVVLGLSGILIAFGVAGCAAAPEGKAFGSFPGEPPTQAKPAPSPQQSPALARIDPADLPSPPPVAAPPPAARETPKPTVENKPGKSNKSAGAKVTLASTQAPATGSSVSQVPSADPAPLFRPVVNLAILRFSLPQGALSQNEGFWKRVDEQSVDAATYDVLFKNGLRVGRAPMVDLEYLMKRLEEQGSPKPHEMTYTASGTKLFEYPMKDVPGQIIYWFDRRNEMSMRSYDASENVFCIEFESAPRKNGAVRVSLCPMVRGVRKQLAAVSEGDELEVQYRAPERRYELNLRADVPLDSVLILAPSPESRSKMSIGHSFLVHDGATGLLEDVLILVPQAAPRANRPADPLPGPDQGGPIPELR